MTKTILGVWALLEIHGMNPLFWVSVYYSRDCFRKKTLWKEIKSISPTPQALQ